MTFAGGQVVSVYRLRLDEFEQQVRQVEGRLASLGRGVPDLVVPVDVAGAKQAAELAKLNAKAATDQARAHETASKAADAAALRQQKLAQAQNATAASAQRLAQAEQGTVTAMQRSAQAAANAAAAQARAESAQLRLAQQQARLADGQQRGRGLTDAFKGSITELAGSFGLAAGGIGTLTAAIGVAGAAMLDTAERARTIKLALGDLGAADLARVDAAAVTLSARFGEDITKQVSAARVVMQAFSTDGAGAMDVLAAGFDAGLNSAEDLLDTLQEYSPYFKALGLDADDTLNILQRGMANGARNTDFIGDAVKELGIRLGELGTAAKLEPLNAELAELVRQIQAGEVSGPAAFQGIVEGINAIEDPVARQTAGVTLFGTKFEDLGVQAIAAMGDVDNALISTAGATDQLNNRIETLGEIAPRVFAALGQALQPVNQFVLDGANGLLTLGNAAQQAGAQALASGGSFAQYTAAVGGSRAAVEQVLAANQGLLSALDATGLGIGTQVAGVLRLVAGNEQLTRSQYEAAQAMVAQGVAADAALSRVQAQAGAYQALDATLAQAGGSLDQFRGQMIALAAASDGNVAQLQVLVTAYNAGDITAQQFAASLAALEQSTLAGANAAQQAADADTNAAGAKLDAADAAITYADAIDQSTDALAENLARTLESEFQTQRLNEAQGRLASLGSAVASGLLTAGQAAGQLAAQYGIASAEALRLINMQAQLARSTAVTKAGLSGVPEAYMGAALGGRASGNIGPSTAALEQIATQTEAAQQRYQAAVATFERQERQLASKGGGAGGGRGGGGGKASPQAKAAQQTNAEMARLDEQRIEQARETARRLEELARDHAERELAINAEYARKQLEAERGLRVQSLNSRADFYDQLTRSTPDIGEEAAQGLAAAYEAAFTEAQKFAQAGQAQLAASYLQLRQQQIGDELSFQQAVAAAKEKKDQAEVDRLNRIEALRKQARDEELKQLVEGGDANVTARDDALTAEQQAFRDRTAEITAAQADKEAKLLASEDKIRAKMAETNQALAERVRLTQQVASLTGASQPTAPTLPQAQAQPPATTTTPLAPTAPGAPVVVDAVAQGVQLASLITEVQRLAGVVEAQQGTLASIASATAETARKVNATRSGS